MKQQLRTQEGFNRNNLDHHMIFCILDTACSYPKVCEAFNALKSYGLITRKSLKKSNQEELLTILTEVGYRWANQKAYYLMDFAHNRINLKTATRKQLVGSILGVGMKLASMFLRNTRGEDFAVMDIHTKDWLYSQLFNKGIKRNSLSYEEEEKWFKKLAKSHARTTAQLDYDIWNYRRKK